MNENENVELEQQIPSNFDESISFEGLDAKYIEPMRTLKTSKSVSKRKKRTSRRMRTRNSREICSP